MSLSIGKKAIAVTQSELVNIDPPRGTDSWFPTKHSNVLQSVEQTLAGANYEVTGRHLLVGNEGHTFFGILDISSEIIDGVNLMVGVRNSNNKRFPMSLCLGTRVLVCANGCFFGDIQISKKHTLNGVRRYKEGISSAIQRLSAFMTQEAARIAALQDKTLSMQHADSIILRSYEEGIVGARLLPKLLKEWRNPSLKDWEDRTAWSLLNCYTEACKPRLVSQPQKAAYETMAFYSLCT